MVSPSQDSSRIIDIHGGNYFEGNIYTESFTGRDRIFNNCIFYGNNIRPMSPKLVKQPNCQYFPQPFSEKAFVNRKKELKTIEEYLLAKKPIFILGAEGFGKTTLANVACHRVKNKFSNGVVWPFFQDLSGTKYNLEMVIEEIARHWGEDIVALSDSSQAKLQNLSWLLQTKNALIVLDLNLDDETLRQVKLAIPHSCTLLITGRRNILEGVDPIKLDEFDTQSCMELIRNVTGMEDNPGNIHICRVLCREFCIKSPSYIKYETEKYSRRKLTSSEIGSLILTLRRRRELAQKQSSLLKKTLRKISEIGFGIEQIDPIFKDIFTEIWGEISEQERQILISVAVCAAQASHDALKYISRLTEAQSEYPLRTLIDHQLLLTSSPRYHLPPLFKQWIVSEQIKNDTTYHHRMAEYFLSYAQQHHNFIFTENLEALELERVNLQAGLKWAVDHGEWRFVADYVDVLNQYWLSTYRWYEFKQGMIWAIDAGKKLNDKKIEAWAYHQRGSVLLCQGNFVDADKDLNRAKELLQKTDGYDVELSTTFHNLGLLYETDNHQVKNATRAYGESLARFQDTNRPTLQYLEKFLDSNNLEHHHWAIEGFAKFDKEKALTLWLQDAKSLIEQRRMFAAQGLGQFTEDYQALEALTSLALDNPKSSKIVEYAINSLGQKGIEFSRELTESNQVKLLSLITQYQTKDTLRKQALVNLGEIGTPDTIASIVLALENEQLRPTARQALDNIKKPQVLSELFVELAARASRLQDPVRQIIFHKIIDFKEATVNFLGYKFERDQSLLTQKLIIEILVQIYHPNALGILQAIIRYPTSDSELHQAASDAVAQHAKTKDDALELLLIIIADDRLRDVGSKSINRVIFNDFVSQSNITARIGNRLNHLNSEVRTGAIRFLAETGNAEIIRLLEQDFRREKNPKIQIEYIRAIGLIGQRANKDSQTSQQAIKSLMSIKKSNISFEILAEIVSQLKQLDAHSDFDDNNFVL